MANSHESTGRRAGGIPCGTPLLRVIAVLCAGLLLASSSALADTRSRVEDRSAFERGWLAVLTGGAAVLNVGLATADRNSPLLGAATLGSGLVLAFADDWGCSRGAPF
jgi:hypothetical protein